MIPLGCIAGDVMGAVGCAAAMHRQGVRVTVAIGAAPVDEGDAAVFALDSGGATVRGRGMAAWEWLRERGCRQVVLHVGAAFENIFPLADALSDALGCGFAPVCPASPETGHTLYQGHLFAGGTLLRESGTGEANLVRVVSRQTDGTVGLTPYATVMRGADAVRRALLGLKEQGRRYAFVDAVSDADLQVIAKAIALQPLVLGSAPLAGALAARHSGAAAALPAIEGHAAVLAGSSDRETLFQIGQARGQLATLELDGAATGDADALTRQALDWAASRLGRAPVVIATAPARDDEELAAALMAGIAAGLVERGVRRLLAAGGATSAAIVRRLGVQRLRIGMEIDPRVVWSYAEGAGPPLLLALKPGDAGGRGIFAGAFQILE